LENDEDIEIEDYETRRRYLKNLDKKSRLFVNGGRFHDDISNAPPNSFYATSQPEYWQTVMEDEHGTDYSYGGIYKIELKKPQSEYFVPSGMGQQAPQTIVKLSNVSRITGPYKNLKDIPK
jgi:hypothetical protein